MMLGHPEAAVAEALGSPGEVAGIVKRNAGIAAFGNRCEIKDGEGNHARYMGGDATLCHAPSDNRDEWLVQWP